MPYRFAFTALAAVLALGCGLGWLAWRLFQQDRTLARQRQTEARELGADSAVALFQQQVARIEQELSALAAGRPPSFQPSSGAAFMKIETRGAVTWPPSALAFHPVPAVISTDDADFLDADRLEFAQSDFSGALRLVTPRKNSADPKARAAALLREARLLRKLGKWPESAASYRELGNLGHALAGGIPAVLASHAGQVDTFTEAADRENAASAAQRLLDELLSGRHRISAETFDVLTESAFRSHSDLLDRARPAIALAEATRFLADRLGDSRLDPVLWINTRFGPVLALPRPAPDGVVAYLASSTAIRTEWLRLAQPALANLRLDIALATPDGRTVAGQQPTSGHSVRLAHVSRLPWTVMVFPASATPTANDPRFILLAGGLAVLFLGAAAAMWLSTRAVAREIELAKLKSEFVATVSHEFRTPLTAIRQLSEMLLTNRVASDDDRRLYYQHLASQGERLHRLVEGLLNFGRLESGKLRLARQRFDAAGFTREEAQHFERQPIASGFSVECNIPHEPAMVEADPDALRLSLANLLENAIKYSPGTGAVAVKVRTENQRVEIAVQDSGPGIDPADRKRIFEKFVRGNAASTQNVPGTGIGLAMARDLMRAQGGDIELTSQLGEGSTFTLVLPRVN